MAHLKLNTKQWIVLGEKLGYIKEGKFLGMFGHKRRKFHGFGMKGENFEEIKESHKKWMKEFNISDTMLADIINLVEELGMQGESGGGIFTLMLQARDTQGSDRERVEAIRQKMLNRQSAEASLSSFMKEHKIKNKEAGWALQDLNERDGLIDDYDVRRINKRWINDFRIPPNEIRRIIQRGKEEGMSINDLTLRLKVMTSDKSVEPGTQGFLEHLFSPITGE